MRSLFTTGPVHPRRVAGGAALIAFLLVAPSASSQENGSDPAGALRFLKPWIERQLFGRETSEPDAAPAPAAASPEASPAPGDAAPDQAPTPAEPATAGDEPEPPSLDERGIELRGSDAPPDVPTGVENPPAEVPPADTVEAPSDSEEEPPGMPVEAKPEPLRFAVLAGRSVAATMATIGPVAEELQMMLGRPVEMLPLASYSSMIDAQVQRRIDGGFFSAAAFAAAEKGCACLEPLAAPRASDGTLAYHAIIVVGAGSGIASLPDLAGKTVAIGAADSIGARRLQLAGLLAEGIDPSVFRSVIEVESAEAAVRMVASGAADAAFAWSSLAGGVDTGYTRGTLTQLVASGEVAMDRVAIIWSSPPVAHGPFAVMRSLAEADKTRIEEYFLALSAANPSAYDLLDPFYGGGYAAVDPQDYVGLVSLLAEDVDALSLPGAPSTTGTTAATPPPAPQEPRPN